MDVLERVDTDISDLFFNHDLSECKLFNKGVFEGYDEDKLRQEAELFLASLSRLGVHTPSSDALIRDFYDRI